MGGTPYTVTYKVEAIIPLEVGLSIIRSQAFEPGESDQTLARDLDLAKENRELAAIRLAKDQGELSRKHQKKV